jgi:NAD(P)-dependent dehydrogenase (short-subunit alcohol dehydrogenase family)
MDDKERKIALVTGGNGGLGYETCRQLAQLGLTALLGACDLTRGKSAAYQLNEKEYLQHSKRSGSTFWTIGCIGQ